MNDDYPISLSKKDYLPFLRLFNTFKNVELVKTCEMPLNHTA